MSLKYQSSISRIGSLVTLDWLVRQLIPSVLRDIALLFNRALPAYFCSVHSKMSHIFCNVMSYRLSIYCLQQKLWMLCPSLFAHEPSQTPLGRIQFVQFSLHNAVIFGIRVSSALFYNRTPSPPSDLRNKLFLSFLYDFFTLSGTDSKGV